MNTYAPTPVVEATPRIAQLLRDNLQLQGWRVEIEYRRAALVERVRNVQPAGGVA